MAKLDSIFPLRIPSKLKEHLDFLSDEHKDRLYYRLRLEIAREVHAANFDPSVYLGED
jgi:hypothetical protein